MEIIIHERIMRKDLRLGPRADDSALSQSVAQRDQLLRTLITASRKLQPSHLALGEPTAHPDLLSNCIDLAESSSRAVCSGNQAAALRWAIADPPNYTTNAKIRVRYGLNLQL